MRLTLNDPVELFDAAGLLWTGSLEQFLVNNGDALDGDDVAEIVADLTKRGQAHLGGGAAPLLTLLVLED